FEEARGKLADAERLAQKALSLREKVLGKDHTAFAASLRKVASLKFRQGDLAGAEALYKRALDIVERQIGKDHISVASALSGLAAIDLARGNVAAAVSHESSAVDIEEHNLGLVIAVGSEVEKKRFVVKLAGSAEFAVALHAHTAPKDAAAERLSLLTI